jgi:hypothetical protein
MGDRNYDFCDDPLNELVASDARIEELEDELAEAQSKILRWISVSERLPEEDVDVLVMTKHGMHVADLDEYGTWNASHGDSWQFPKPSHWMPLPEPPEVT